MEISIYHIDTFTDKLFSGNPAAVCLLPYWLSDDQLFAISSENNLPATAFLIDQDSHYEIRWFAPDYEIPLCGHGSLAAAYVIFNKFKSPLQKVALHSAAGVLAASQQNNVITLNFPLKNAEEVSIHPILLNGLNIKPEAVYQYQNERCIVVLSHQSEVEQLKPNMEILQDYNCSGIVVTAPGETVDFVSRTFYPRNKISEDPVTGSSHCMLAPYWAKRLGKNELKAYQASARGGYLTCTVQNDNVLLSAQAVLYSQGSIFL